MLRSGVWSKGTYKVFPNLIGLLREINQKLMTDYHQALLPDKIYHLYSRAVGDEKLFLNEGNYQFFLQNLKKHTDSVCQIYCYSLLPNHFHFLVRIRDESNLIQHFDFVKKKTYSSLDDDLADFVMERFSNFLNSYTKSFNKVNDRKGALFMDYLKRSSLEKDENFSNYI